MKDFHRDVEKSLGVLRGGGVIIYPTDTVWGLGADALNEDAIEKVFSIKGRSYEKSFIILLSKREELSKYTKNLPLNIVDILDSFSQPTTVIYPEAQNLPAGVTHPNGSVAIRITDDPFLKSLIQGLGSPLVSTSANLSGLPTPSTFIEIDSAIKEGVDYVVRYRQDDALKTSPSRVIKFSLDGSFVVVRE